MCHVFVCAYERKEQDKTNKNDVEKRKKKFEKMLLDKRKKVSGPSSYFKSYATHIICF